MELTAEELKLIQDRRNAESKKAEEAAKANRTKEEKATELFQIKANAQNADALDLATEINAQSKEGQFICIKNVFKSDRVFVEGKSVDSSEVGFVNFGTESVTVADKFGNAISVYIDSRKMSEGSRYDTVNKFTIHQDYSHDFRVYHGDKDKNAARIVIKRLEEIREKQLIKERKLNKREIAEAYIKECFPKAGRVSISDGQYSQVMYYASNFDGVYEFTEARGEVWFNDDMTVKSKTVSLSSIHSDKTEKDIKLKAMKAAYEAACAKALKEFNENAIEVLNA